MVFLDGVHVLVDVDIHVVANGVHVIAIVRSAAGLADSILNWVLP